MILRKILIVVSFICCGYSFSQNVKDSLMFELKKHPQKDTIHCNLIALLIEDEVDHEIWINYNSQLEKACNEIITKGFKNKAIEKNILNNYASVFYNYSFYYTLKKEYQKANPFVEKAIKIYKKLNLNDEVSACYNILALNNANVGDVNIAEKYFLVSIQIAKANKYNDGLLATYQNYSDFLASQSNFTKAIALQFEILKLNNQKDLNIDAACFNRIGSYYGNENEILKAVEYFNKSINTYKKVNNQAGLSSPYNNLAVLYYKKNQFEKALQNLDLCIKYEPEEDNMQSYLLKGQIYSGLKQYDLAKTFLEKSEKLASINNPKIIQCAINLAFGKIYFSENNYSKSLSKTSKSLEIAKNNKLIENQIVALNLLYQIYKKQKNYKESILVLEESTRLEDSIDIKNNKNAMLKADFKYQTEKKEAEIKNLAQKKQIAELESKRKTSFLLLFGILFLAIASTAYVLFSRFKTKKQNEILQNKLAETQNLLEAEKKVAESELKALKSQMNPHFIFNALNGIQAQFMYGDKLVANEQLNNFTYLTRQILEVSGKRNIAIADEVDILTKYLELEQMRFKKDLTYNISVDQNIDEDYFKIPPMLLQPIVENSIKHGLLHQKGNKNVSVNFDISNDESHLICTVIDNGIGREKSAEIKSKSNLNHNSFSTNAIEERLELLNNNLKLNDLITYEDVFNSEKEVCGTKVVIKIPLI